MIYGYGVMHPNKNWTDYIKDFGHLREEKSWFKSGPDSFEFGTNVSGTVHSTTYLTMIKIFYLYGVYLNISILSINIQRTYSLDPSEVTTTPQRRHDGQNHNSAQAP